MMTIYEKIGMIILSVLSYYSIFTTKTKLAILASKAFRGDNEKCEKQSYS